MRCDRAREVLFEYRTGLLAAAEREEVAGHLNECEMCRRQLADLTSFEVTARDWQDLEPPLWDPRSVIPGAPPGMARLAVRWLPLAAALVLTVFVAAGTEFGRTPDGFYVRFGVEEPSPPEARAEAATADELQSAIDRLRAQQSMEQELLREALMTASSSQRRRELEAMLALVRAQLDEHAEDTRDSLRFVIDLQRRDQQRLSELDQQLQRIGYQRGEDTGR